MNAENDEHVPVRTYVEDSGVRKRLVTLCSCSEYHLGRIVPHGFREPPEGWYVFGTHVDVPVRLEFSEETDEALMPLWERPIPPATTVCGHPSGEVMFGRCAACGSRTEKDAPIHHQESTDPTRCWECGEDWPCAGYTAEKEVCVVPGCTARTMLCRVVCREHNPRPWSEDDGKWREPYRVIPPAEGDSDD